MTTSQALFSFSGCIARLPYFIYLTLTTVFFIITLTIGFVLMFSGSHIHLPQAQAAQIAAT